MTNHKEDILTDHDYDGIKEHDNPLPGWWLFTFFATIIFGFHYWLYFTFGGAPTQIEEANKDMAEYRQMQKKAEPPAGEPLNAGQADAQAAKAIFSAKCAVCHGPELQGSIGPNLTDQYWIHGQGKPEDILTVIRAGVPDKGMPAWEGQLSGEELKQVALYVASAKGSNPPNPKPPQGNKVGN